MEGYEIFSLLEENRGNDFEHRENIIRKGILRNYINMVLDTTPKNVLTMIIIWNITDTKIEIN